MAKRNSISINGRKISNEFPPYIIAEISANHNGSIETALQIIKSAKEAGVDAVKIQTYTPDTMTIDSNKDDFLIKGGLWKNRNLYQLYSEACTPFEWHQELFTYADAIGVTLFSSPFDESAVDLLESLGAPAYKVASFEMVDHPLIEYIASTGKPILMSTGMANIDEIYEAIEAAKSGGCKELALFHCISGYPTPLKESKLSAIQLLKKEFNLEIGFSDHTLGTTASIVATSLGASMIEKHFIISREMGGVDSTFSLNEEEMKELVHSTRDAFDAICDSKTLRSEIELENKIFRRSLYFISDLKEGEIIQDKHIRRIRPGYGLPPKFYKSVLGKKVNHNVERGDPVTEKSVDL